MRNLIALILVALTLAGCAIAPQAQLEPQDVCALPEADLESSSVACDPHAARVCTFNAAHERSEDVALYCICVGTGYYQCFGLPTLAGAP